MLDIDSIGTASTPFLLVAVSIVATGWFARNKIWFEIVLAGTGVIVALSWLSVTEAIFLIALLLPNWLYLQHFWRDDRPTSAALTRLLIILPVVALVAVKSDVLSATLGVTGIVGISYIVFRQIHLVMLLPNLRRSTSLTAWSWLAYLLNPLTLLAGPIQTWNDHKEGMSEIGRPCARELVDGIHRALTGLLKVLVLAPILNGQTEIASLTSSQPNWLEIGCVLYGYYIFLYLDFSGYIDIVCGIAQSCRYKGVPENFAKPYLASDFQDFWQRWNITLGVWFRNHVFNVLVAVIARRLGPRSLNLSTGLSLFTIFLLIGLWHGLAWNYVLFGLVHACGVSATYLIRQRAKNRAERSWRIMRWNGSASRFLRIVVFQHLAAASFILLNNPVSDLPLLWEYLT